MLPWNVYPLFPPGTTPFVMLLVMPSVMPLKLGIFLTCLFFTSPFALCYPATRLQERAD